MPHPTRKRASPRKARKKVTKHKRSVGRPSKYSATFPDKLIQHFRDRLTDAEGRTVPVLREIGVDLPTLGSFARTINVSPRTLTNWCNTYEEFKDAVDIANSIQADMLESLTLKGVWIPSMAMFSLKFRHGWVDKVSIEAVGNIHLHFDDVDKEA